MEGAAGIFVAGYAEAGRPRCERPFRSFSRASRVITQPRGPPEAYTRLSYGDDAGGEIALTQIVARRIFAKDYGFEWIHRWLVFIAVAMGWTALCVLIFAAGVCGLVVARRWRGFAAMGLWNMGTVVMLWSKVRKPAVVV